jgi:dGTP triphosphohydrolase
VPLREFTEQLLTSKAQGSGYSKDEHCYARAVADYVASMTEVEFKDLWKRMCPGEHLSALHADLNRFEFETGD